MELNQTRKPSPSIRLNAAAISSYHISSAQRCLIKIYTIWDGTLPWTRDICTPDKLLCENFWDEFVFIVQQKIRLHNLIFLRFQFHDTQKVLHSDHINVLNWTVIRKTSHRWSYQEDAVSALKLLVGQVEILLSAVWKLVYTAVYEKTFKAPHTLIYHRADLRLKRMSNVISTVKDQSKRKSPIGL